MKLLKVVGNNQKYDFRSQLSIYDRNSNATACAKFDYWMEQSNIQTTNTGIASKFGLGRKAGEGVRVAVEEGKVPSISVEAYVLVKYGQRIPDLAWDVQEKIKANLDRYTG